MLQRFATEALQSSNAPTKVLSALSGPCHLFSPLLPKLHHQKRLASSSSSTRWKTRQGRDSFARNAKVQGLKSRAAFKLLEIHGKYKLLKPGDTVVDLGYAPGSWSQVAVNLTKPTGRVIGIDLLPAEPLRGVTTIHGNFLSPEIQAEVRAHVQDLAQGQLGQERTNSDEDDVDGFVELQRAAAEQNAHRGPSRGAVKRHHEEDRTAIVNARDTAEGRVVDVVLSDMMMNTSGNAFRDHAGSMDLCMAALTFAFDTLRTDGHFVCKFYQGGEDKAFEKTLRRMFERVGREKPSSSRSDSKEGFFVAMRRKELPSREEVFESD